VDLAQLGRPAQEAGVACFGSGQRTGCEASTELIQGDGNMPFNVGVDSDRDNDFSRLAHGNCRWSLSKFVLTHAGEAVGQVCDGTRSGSYKVTPDPHRRGRELPRPTDESLPRHAADRQSGQTGREQLAQILADRQSLPMRCTSASQTPVVGRNPYSDMLESKITLVTPALLCWCGGGLE
jgi:hypothetical protein